jgi:magnesium and cobalt exporter, CNNM family
MMVLLLISVAAVLTISALCSLTEAALYAVRRPYIRTLDESGSTAGRILSNFKQNMEQPIAAILIVNTVANTAGATIAGAQAQVLFGESSLLWFSVLFTLSVLMFSEIIPKILGVVYSRPVSRLLAVPWAWIIRAIYPLIWIIEVFTKVLKPSDPVLFAPEEEVEQMARISAEEGSILDYEADLVKNVLQLDQITARQIMTPRPVVLKLPDNLTLKEAFEKVEEWTYSRIPLYAADDPETWTGFVLSSDILAEVARDQFNKTLGSVAKPLFFVSEELRGHLLLKSFLKRRTHLFGVMDDFGDLTGVVTLEDVLESVIGEEIVDEVDVVADMQDVARRRKREQFGSQNRQYQQEEPNGDSESAKG